MNGDAIVDVAGEALAFLPERAAYWPARRTLLVADVHWGKDESFRAHGIPIPTGILERDLSVLGALIARTDASRMLVLGDLIHDADGLAPNVVDRIGDWRHAHPIAVHLIPGNHDRRVRALPDSWRIDVLEDVVVEPPFRFIHAPPAEPGAFAICGHVHPAIKLRRGPERLRLPCFHLANARLTLPSFGTFTGGAEIDRRGDDRIFAVADDRVVEV